MINEIMLKHDNFLKTNKNLDIEYRLNSLKKLKNTLKKYEKEVNNALYNDLNKSEYESYLTEIGFVYKELEIMIKNTKKWGKPYKVHTPTSLFKAKSLIYPEPFGKVLIMSPWNYPFMLSMQPLIGAIAAGNTCILKPSNYSKNTSNIILKIIEETFDRGHVDCILGGREENTQLLEQRFDYIFFTGSVEVGKLVMLKASKYLTPVTLELGGKSPCIVDEDIDINLTAKRIVFGKLINSGQTCIAPDYILVHEKVKDLLLNEMKREITNALGDDPISNNEYPKIINEKHFERLIALIDSNKVFHGARYNKDSLKIEPTIFDNVNLNSSLMKEELFGPLLPIISYKKIDEVFNTIKLFEKPLALYIFSNNKKFQEDVVNNLSFGGSCINDTLMHITNESLPFGGVGYSGMGLYHGKYSFDTFSHKKSVLNRSVKVDLPFRYHPYKEKFLNLIKKII